MDTTLIADTRTDTGKGVARKLRASGKIPAVLYADGSEATQIAVDPKVLSDLFRISRNRNTVIALDVGGERVEALVRDAQRNPLTRELLHVDFYRLTPGKEVEVMVPVSTSGKPVGAALGGRIQIVRRDVKVRCAQENIPATIDIDVSALDIGDMIRASQVAMPEGAALVYSDDFQVVACLGKKR